MMFLFLICLFTQTYGLRTYKNLETNHSIKFPWPSNIRNYFASHGPVPGKIKPKNYRPWEKNDGKGGKSASHCPGAAKNIANLTDDVKSVVLEGLMKASQTMNYRIKPGQMSNVPSRSRFPDDFKFGFGISAGPPPQDNRTEYQTTNKIGWYKKFQEQYKGDSDEQERALNDATAELQTLLENPYNNLGETFFFQVDGIYEQCAEKSFIVKAPNIFEAARIGERLRSSFFQDTYLLFDTRTATTSWDDCGKGGAFEDAKPVNPPWEKLTGATPNTYYRAIYLGFGAKGYHNQPTTFELQLGNLCEFPAENLKEDEHPMACSIDKDKGIMWADTNVAYDQYDPAKNCL